MIAFPARVLALVVPLCLMAVPEARAFVQTMRCDGRFSYSLSYDDLRKRLTIEVEGMKRVLQIRRVKSENNVTLIWASTPTFGGDRDMLIQFDQFGRDKWVRTYFRNGSDETVKCR